MRLVWWLTWWGLTPPGESPGTDPLPAQGLGTNPLPAQGPGDGPLAVGEEPPGQLLAARVDAYHELLVVV